MLDSFFIDINKRKNVANIFPPIQFNINCDLYGIKTNDRFNITVEKAEMHNLMQIRISDCGDQTKIFYCTIDSSLYDQIRVEQSLHVSFQGFVDHLTKILESCKRDELFIAIVRDERFFALQFYEKRSFRNLIHLYLPIKEAPVGTILFHLNQSLKTQQEQVSFFSNLSQKHQKDLLHRDDYINELTQEIHNLKAKIQEQENLVFNRNCEELSKLQQTIKHITESKETEEKKYKNLILKLQEQNELLSTENCNLTEKLIQESKKFESVREKLNKSKLCNENLKEEVCSLKAELTSYENRDKKQDHISKEHKKQIFDLNEKIRSFDKQKSDLAAELEAEKNICHTKRNALQIATDEIAKANQIILKQSKDISALKKTIDWRTEIALRQEKALNGKENKNKELNKIMEDIMEEHQQNCNKNLDFSQTLIQLRESTDEIEDKYNRKLQDLQRKLSTLTGGEKVQNKYLRSSNRDF